MKMPPRVRKLALTAHVTCSVGWFGAVVTYLALAVAALNSSQAQFVRGAYGSMELIGWCVIVPFSLAAFLTGLVQSLGTQWGLARYYWVLAKLALALGGTVVLVVHLRTAVSPIAALAAKASETTLTTHDFGPLPLQLIIHAAGGLVVLLAATVISVFKPWGMTRWGRRVGGASSPPMSKSPT